MPGEVFLLGLEKGDQALINVHSASACAGRACTLHNPSDHHMRDWPMNYRGDKGLMERICPDPTGSGGHGIGHPDPDDMAYHASRGDEAMGVHGCDGCCSGITRP